MVVSLLTFTQTPTSKPTTTAKSASSERILFIAASNGHKDVAKVLLFHGAEVDIEDKEGESPLHRGGFNKIQINKYSKRIY